MNSLRRMLLAASAAAVLLTTSAIAADTDVTGEWDLTVESPAGTGTPWFKLKQEGAKVTGSYKGALGEAPVTGTVKGNAISIEFHVEAQGMEMDVTYEGTVDGPTMSGKVTLGDFGEGTFTGKKKG